FLGAVLTGVFCFKAINDSGADGLRAGNPGQVLIQLYAAVVSAVFSLVVSLVLVKLVDVVLGFATDARSETEGLDRTEHGEVGFDLGQAMEAAPAAAATAPRPARVPPNGVQRFSVIVDGVPNGDLMHAWSNLCQPRNAPPSAEFQAVYPFVTT